MILETNRLYMRPFTQEDAPALHRILSCPAVMKYIEPPFTYEQTLAFLERFGLTLSPAVFALVRKDSNSLIGHVIWHPDDENTMELGWVIDQAHWGQGFAQEISKELIQQAMHEEKHVALQCHPEQAATCAIAKKLGFYDLGLEDGLRSYRYLYKSRSGCMDDKQREALIRQLLGRVVTVVIDRPIGYVHVTNGITLRYAVNYGYLPGITGGDGEEQDVYVLGVEEPVKEFTGQIIAVIRRFDDSEDKLVIAHEGSHFTAEEILKKVWFVEQYFAVSVELYAHAADNV